MAKKKAPSKKRRQAPPGIDPNEKRRERLEARRRAKAEAIAAQQRAERRARLLRTFLYVGLLALAIWFFFIRNPNPVPDEIADRVETYSDAGENDHAAQGETVTYEESPPVSGRHAPNPAPCGTYGEPVPNENLVHSLEHGAVYLLYSPELPPDQIAQLEEIASGYEENVLSAPYEGEMETPIAVGSWGERMDLDEVDEDAIATYIDTFAGEGPESDLQTCENSSEQTFDPEDQATPGAGTGGGNEQEDPTEEPSPKES
jgi:hypothetical protein